MDFDVRNLIPQELRGKNGIVTLGEVQDAQFFGLYFSAHWCPPCRMFTPVLADFYNKVNKNSKKLEIIFISSDQTEDQFEEYYETMPWITIPFDSESKEIIGDAFQIQGIPTFLVFDKNGKLIDPSGRNTVQLKKEGAIAEWESKVK